MFSISRNLISTVISLHVSLSVYAFYADFVKTKKKMTLDEIF